MTTKSKGSKQLKLPDLENFEFSEIDKTQLDEEWIRQEKLVGQFCKLAAEARKNVDIAKSALEVAEAKIDKRIRQHPERYNMERPTEGAIAKELVLQMEDLPEPKRLIKAKFELAIVQACVDRLQARGKAITDLIFLFSIEYFARPKIPKGMKKSDSDKITERKISKFRDE